MKQRRFNPNDDETIICRRILLNTVAGGPTPIEQTIALPGEQFGFSRADVLEAARHWNFTTEELEKPHGVTARVHPLKSKQGKQRYSVIFRGKLLVERSCDPECDAARALFLQGISGKLHLSDAGGFSVTKKREAWGVRYLYTPRPPMLRTIVDIEKAARLRSVETGNAPRFRRNETCAESAKTAQRDNGEVQVA